MDAALDSPHHGFQGDRGAPVTVPSVPLSLTIAISREAGARGGSVGRRVGRRLGWQVYDQELLEYIAQEGTFRQELVEHLSAAAGEWAEQQLERLRRDGALSQHPAIIDLAR